MSEEKTKTNGGTSKASEPKTQKNSKIPILAVALLGIAAIWAKREDIFHTLLPRIIDVDSPLDMSFPPRGELKLENCEEYDAPFVCGRLGAPLDYTNDSDTRNASIAVIVYPAGAGKTKKEDILGSLILNPGGPGVSGVNMVGEGRWYDESLVSHLDAVLEGKYNLVGFDPRGAGKTYPRTHCFGQGPQKDERELAYYSSLAADGFPGYNHKDRSDFEIGKLLAHKKLLADLCASSEDAEMLKFIGTPFTARDMKLLHEALGDSVINYWGFSYGTVIGSTYADMFPSHVGRMILDGVIEMPDYYSGRWWTSLHDIDQELSHFFSECESSEFCKLRNVVSAPGQLETEVMKWLESLKTEPGYTKGRPNDTEFVPPQLVTYSSVMLTFFEILREPLKWQALSDGLYAAMADKDFRDLARQAGPGEENEEYYAIGCSDSLSQPREFGIEDYKHHSKALLKDSPLFGDLFSPSGVMCTGIWPIRAVERWYGNFTAQTSFPLLVLGNDLDPVTPGKCADDLAMTFPRAVSVRRAGYGHCSFSQPSQCIDQTVHDYLVRGQLPEAGTRCSVDKPIFA